MTAKVIPFNPLDKKNLGASVAEALLTKEVHPLSQLPQFDGAGIYAIYYTGDFDAYAQIARLNNDEKFMLPIYVGKAVPAGARMGACADVPPGKVLFKRLRDALNKSIGDNSARF